MEYELTAKEFDAARKLVFMTAWHRTNVRHWLSIVRQWRRCRHWQLPEARHQLRQAWREYRAHAKSR